MDIDEIEYQVASGNMTAMQTFTKMKELCLPESKKSKMLDCKCDIHDPFTLMPYKCFRCRGKIKI